MTTLALGWQKRRGLMLDVAPALLALGLMFWLGLIPLRELPGPQFELNDKVWHLVAFGGLAGLLSRTFAYFGRPAAAAARDAALLSIALGGALELLQSLTAFRSADWADFLADSLGAALAYGVLRWVDAAAVKAPA